jgi:hypothetical protein
MRLRHIVALPLFAACYRYAPIEPASAKPGSGVRARLTVDAGRRLAPLLGTPDTRLIAGRLIDNQASGMIIEVPSIRSGGVGSSAETLNQRISVAPSDLVELESRLLDRVRTGAVVGGLLAVAVVATIKALAGESSNSGRVPDPGTTELRVPLFRFVP